MLFYPANTEYNITCFFYSLYIFHFPHKVNDTAMIIQYQCTDFDNMKEKRVK